MCGISGIIGGGELEKDVTQMMHTQHHRGPDASGVYMDKGFAAFGHNRLAIIDLSPSANQPFNDPTGRYTLVYNGEVYNFKELKQQLKSGYDFHTECDTEVVLAAFLRYGKECLHRFNGMFAFAIWDAKEKRLFASRDRFGVKPFFYTKTENGFYFSSEIKAIRSVIKTGFDKKVFANYFAYGSYGLPDQSFFQDIKQLPGGYYLNYEEEKVKLTKWYVFEEQIAVQPKNQSFSEAKEQYTELLKESIALRFRADVPVGFNISGGVDSSVLLAMVNLRKNAYRVQAFTFYTGDERYDELPWVEEMIAHTKTPLNRLLFTVDNVETYAKEISKIQDEPFGGIPTLAYAKIFKEAQQKGVKVLLDGQGMDEAWAGYDYYYTHSSQTIQGQGIGSSPFKKDCLSNELLALAEKPKYPEPFDNDVLNKQYRDLFYTKLPRALRFNDRVSMAASSELREPFLDHRLVEFAFSLPNEYKYQNGQNKYLLREILKEYVSEKVVYAPKRPLQTPQREWLGDELQDLVAKSIEDIHNSEYSYWFDKAEMLKEWELYKEGRRESSFHLWQWVNFSLLATENRHH